MINCAVFFSSFNIVKIFLLKKKLIKSSQKCFWFFVFSLGERRYLIVFIGVALQRTTRFRLLPLVFQSPLSFIFCGQFLFYDIYEI